MYTATIHTKNYRDTNTITPKVLLTDICNETSEFRDHCWVAINKHLDTLIKKTRKPKLTIKFSAKVKVYQTYGPAKETLASIKKIEVVH
jgi:hypothetical protein